MIVLMLSIITSYNRDIVQIKNTVQSVTFPFVNMSFFYSSPELENGFVSLSWLSKDLTYTCKLGLLVWQMKKPKIGEENSRTSLVDAWLLDYVVEDNVFLWELRSVILLASTGHRSLCCVWLCVVAYHFMFLCMCLFTMHVLIIWQWNVWSGWNRLISPWSRMRRGKACLDMYTAFPVQVWKMSLCLCVCVCVIYPWQ